MLKMLGVVLVTAKSKSTAGLIMHQYFYLRYLLFCIELQPIDKVSPQSLPYPQCYNKSDDKLSASSSLTSLLQKTLTIPSCMLVIQLQSYFCRIVTESFRNSWNIYILSPTITFRISSWCSNLSSQRWSFFRLISFKKF